MNVANRELSEELFKLSGWLKGTEKFWFFPEGAEEQLINKPFVPNGFNEELRCPAYPLGYLIRKLPDEATSKKHGGSHYFYMHHNSDWWYAYYGVIDTTEFMDYADTPEDAACQLAINLFKQGILKKEAGGSQ